jgi:hypothetical protein
MRNAEFGRHITHRAKRMVQGARLSSSTSGLPASLTAVAISYGAQETSQDMTQGKQGTRRRANCLRFEAKKKPTL